jgi:GNAT superfamily N-acetyltransferase
MRRELDQAPTATSQAVVLVRRAEHQDLRAAADVYIRSRRAAIPAIPPMVHDDDDVRAWFADTVFAKRELWIAVRASGAVIGIMVLDDDSVDQLYVDPRHTGDGVGSELLAVAQSHRPAGLQLWTFQSNEGARRFYERHGFTPVEWTDGAGNEEGVPDMRYVWNPS